MPHTIRQTFLLIMTIYQLASIAPVNAQEQASQLTELPAVLTLDEAARFLRLEEGELKVLAQQQKVPARQIGHRWRFNREALLAWLNGDWTLIATAVPSPSETIQESVPSLEAAVMADVIGAGTTLAKQTLDAPIGKAPEERTADQVFLRGQRVLLAPGGLTLDVGLFYSESSNLQLALLDGNIGLAVLEADSFTGLLHARYGLFEETEIFASTTLHDRQRVIAFGSEQLSASSDTELGDVRLGLRRTLLREGPGRPDIVATFEGHIPTGDSSYALGGGLAFVKSVDPAVLFANVNYRHIFSRDFIDVTRLQPQNRFDITLGYAFALNDTLTLSTALSGLFTAETRFDNATLRQQELFSLRFGLTSRLAEGLYIEPTVSFGLNGPGNSFVFGVTMPYTF